MATPEFSDEQVAERFGRIVEAERSLEIQAFLMRRKQEVEQGIGEIATTIRQHDPYPDNLGDRHTRQTGTTQRDESGDEDGLWYQGRL